MKKIVYILSTLVMVTTYAQAQRKVLIEQFTNSGCPLCAPNTPAVANYVNSHSNEVLMLAYHTSFPYSDSMYFENSFQNDERVNYYNVSGVPLARVDGNFFSGNVASSLNTTIPDAGAVAPRYNISFNTNILNGNNVSTNITFESIDSLNSGESLVAMVVVAEKNVLKSAYECCPGNNSETQYPWVARRMLPDETGTILQHTELSGVDGVSVNWSANNFKDLSEMRIVAFVQNTVTKAIYQSEISTPTIVSSVDEVKGSNDELFSLYPSIAKDFVKIQFKNPNKNSQVKILNLLAKEMYSSKVNTGELKVETSTFSAGIYLVQMESNGEKLTKKFIVNH